MRWIIRLPEVEIVPETRRVGDVVPDALPSRSALKVAGTAPPIKTEVLASMIASSAEVGTWAGAQLVELNQSLLAEPVQLRVAAWRGSDTEDRSAKNAPVHT